MIEERRVCPLGSECRRIVGDHMEVCSWLMTIKTMDSEAVVASETEQCAITAAVTINQSGHNPALHGTLAMQSLRNLAFKAAGIASDRSPENKRIRKGGD